MNVSSTVVKTIFGTEVIVSYRPETTDMDTVRSVMIYDEYSAFDFAYQDGDTFIDLGSHIGCWSLLMASLNKTFKIYAVEPIPENFELLAWNTMINNYDNIFPYKLAISGKTGETTVWYTDDTTPFGKAHKYVGSSLGGGGRPIRVHSISLEELFNSNNIQHCHAIKSDCEGGEFGAFSSLSKNNLNKIDYVIGEFHPSAGMTIKDFYPIFEGFFIDESWKIDDDPSVFPHMFLYVNKRIMP